jgi:hypothetical protein
MPSVLAAGDTVVTALRRSITLIVTVVCTRSCICCLQRCCRTRGYRLSLHRFEFVPFRRRGSVTFTDVSCFTYITREDGDTRTPLIARARD